MDGVEVAGHNLLGNLVDEGLSTGAAVVHGEAGSHLSILTIHQANGVGLAVDVNAHQ